VRRNLDVTIARGTWPSSGTPAFPSTLHSGKQVKSVNINSTLLLIGHLTTPAAGRGVSLSELWAWVRYYYAIAPAHDLRLTREFWELDSHQKTILSDDFGIGFPMSFLINPLDLVGWSDGRDFADRFSALTVPLPAVPKKSGPTKSPDFVCLDGHGRFHVIECKGTQSGQGKRAKQFSDTNAKGVATGAIVQKRMIVLQPAYQGQRLACGIAIAREGAKQSSDLRIEDPDGDEKIFVNTDQVALAADPIFRATAARSLRAAGLSATADTIAAPSGPNLVSRSDPRPIARRGEARRQAFIEERRGRARTELQAGIATSGFVKRKEKYVGRHVVIHLPKPVTIEGKNYTRIEIREGVRREVVADLMGDALEDVPIQEAASWLPARLSGIKLVGEATSAEMIIGDLFVSDLHFLP
jgi:hypothetical protein